MSFALGLEEAGWGSVQVAGLRDHEAQTLVGFDEIFDLPDEIIELAINEFSQKIQRGNPHVILNRRFRRVSNRAKEMLRPKLATEYVGPFNLISTALFQGKYVIPPAPELPDLVQEVAQIVARKVWGTTSFLSSLHRALSLMHRPTIASGLTATKTDLLPFVESVAFRISSEMFAIKAGAWEDRGKEMLAHDELYEHLHQPSIDMVRGVIIPTPKAGTTEDILRKAFSEA